MNRETAHMHEVKTIFKTLIIVCWRRLAIRAKISSICSCLNDFLSHILPLFANTFALYNLHVHQ